MNFKSHLSLALLLWSTGLGFAQGTGFTCQGSLGRSNAPANGPHDFRFQLYGSSNAGPALTFQLTQTNVAVSNGLFRVTLDFGAGPFNGQLVWMEVAVRHDARSAASVSEISNHVSVTTFHPTASAKAWTGSFRSP
jgi:hypothetical protein